MRGNPIKVDSSGKADVLRYIGELYADASAEEKHMKKRNIRRIVIIAAAVVSLTMMVSAALVGYLYRTPDGQLVDESGNTTEQTHAQSAENSKGIHGDGYSIRSVTWTQANGRTTLAVWVTPDSDELVGLKAVIDGAEYPLEKKTFNLSSGYIGYTTTNIDQPTEFTLVCDSPAFSESVSFVPEEVIPAESYSNGMTLFGTTSGRVIYIGINDENYLNSELFRHAELSFVKTVEETVTDNTGTEYSGCSGGSNRDNNMLTQMNYDEKIPAGNTAVSLNAQYLKVIYNFMEAADLDLAPAVKVPLPEEGETISGEWHLVNADGFSYIINSITRNGNELVFRSENSLTYDGVYKVAEDMPGNYIYALIKGNGNTSFTSGGSNEEWTIGIRDNESFEDYMDENGEIILSIFEMGVTYTGDWHLDFAE